MHLVLEVGLELGDELEALLLRVRLVRHARAPRERVVHRQLALEVGDLALVLLEHDRGVLELDDARLVDHVAHARREVERRDRLLEVADLAVDVGDQQRLAVAAQRVLEQVRQLRLPVRHVALRLGAERHDDLLEVRERAVDVHRLGLEVARAVGLLDALRAREVDQVELAPHHLLRRLDARAQLQVDCEDRVAARRLRVELVLGDGAVGLALEEQLQRLLLALHLLDAQPLDVRRAVGALDERQRLAVRVLARQRREQVDERVVVDLEVRDADGGVVLRRVVHKVEDLGDRARRDAAVLVARGAAQLRVGLAGAGLAVAHDRAVEALQHGVDHRLRHLVVHRLLRRVVQHRIVLPAPRVLGVVCGVRSGRRWQLDRDVSLVHLDAVRREASGGPRAHRHLDHGAWHLRHGGQL